MSATKVLAPEWAAWIGENLAAGASREAIVETLVENGVARGVATARVVEIDHATAPLRARVRASELHARLMRELGKARGKGIERRKKPPAREFFSRYWANAEPVVFTDAAKGWKLWSPEDMKRLVGDERIRVARGRFRKEFVKTTVARFVDDVVLAKRRRDDLYLVANSFAMDAPGMRPLLRRIVVDRTYFDLDAVKRGMALWLGPKGTVTPLHHDTTNILFFQIHGRKEVRLISPFTAGVLERANGFYSDARVPASRGERVVLSPGDALFLPAGWWHEVRALDASISFSLLAFRRPNDFSFYRPGFPARARAAT